MKSLSNRQPSRSFAGTSVWLNLNKSTAPGTSDSCQTCTAVIYNNGLNKQGSCFSFDLALEAGVMKTVQDTPSSDA